MVGRKLFGARQYRFHHSVMRRYPGSDEGSVFKTVAPEHVLRRAKPDRDGCFIGAARNRITDGDVRCGGGDFMVLIKARQEGWRKSDCAGRSGSQFYGLDLIVTPARNLNADALQG